MTGGRKIGRKLTGFVKALCTDLLAQPALHRVARALLGPRRNAASGGGSLLAARSILIVKPDELGDCVLASGFIRAVRSACPAAHITLLIKESNRELFAFPEFADECQFVSPAWTGVKPSIRAWKSLIVAARETGARQKPDWVLIPRSCRDYAGAAYYAWWTGAPEICTHERFCTESRPRRFPFCNRLVDDRNVLHELDCHRAMLDYLGLSQTDCRPALVIPDRARQGAKEALAAVGGKDFVIALGIGAGSPDRRWPVERFAALARAILDRCPGAGIIVVGGRQDEAAGASIAGLAPTVIANCAGRLTLLETAAALERCQVFAGNDSGPMHLAATAGCATIEISKHPKNGHPLSYNSPERFGPRARWSQVVQPQSGLAGCEGACDKSEPHCIASISVDEVLAAVESAMRAEAAAGHGGAGNRSMAG